MDWMSVNVASGKIAIAQEAVRLIPEYGVSTKAFAIASEAIESDASAWRRHFPGGLTEALWFISEVSDASMANAFNEAPAHDLATVVAVRLDQNASLKPFVRRVMLYDFMHPFQAIERMQRTAKVMYGCTLTMSTPSFRAVATLNCSYTLLIMLWILDLGPTNRLTRFLIRFFRQPA